MTKVQNPIIGRSRGSAGGMTFSKSLGKNIMRAKAFEVANPKTAAQTTQRNFFKEVSQLSQGLNPTQLRALFPVMPKAITRRNLFTQQLLQGSEIVAGSKVFKLANVQQIGNGVYLSTPIYHYKRGAENPKFPITKEVLGLNELPATGIGLWLIVVLIAAIFICETPGTSEYQEFSPAPFLDTLGIEEADVIITCYATSDGTPLRGNANTPIKAWRNPNLP